MRSANQFKAMKSCVPFPLKPCVVGVFFLFGSACSMQSVAASNLKDGHVVIHNDQNIEGEEGLHEEVSEGGSIEISNSANLNISGSAGIQAVTHGDASSDTAGDITITTSDKSDIAADHDGVSASSNGESGDILMDVQGKIASKEGDAITANSQNGNIVIKADGDFSGDLYGISASNQGKGDVLLNVSGSVTNDGANPNYGDAISVRGSGGAVIIDTSKANIKAAKRGIIATTTGGSVNITAGNIKGGDAQGGDGINVYHNAKHAGDGDINITTVAGTDIEAHGWGIAAWSQGTVGGININANGTMGKQHSVGQNGVSAEITNKNNHDAINVVVNGKVHAYHNAVQAITKGNGDVSVSNSATLLSDADEGIVATSQGGQVLVKANANIVGGKAAILAGSANGNVVVDAHADITSTKGSALILKEAKTATVDNFATASSQDKNSAVIKLNASDGVTVNNHAGADIEGASDLAIQSQGGHATINNAGKVSGFINLNGENNTFINEAGGLFEMRHRTDEGGQIAQSLINGSFNNQAGSTLSLLNTEGVKQGQLLGVIRFENSGVITLQAQDAGSEQAVPGGVLIISGGHEAGQSGKGLFVSNGGSLLLDTVLNAGGTQSLTDKLIVDRTSTGSGATKVFIKNVGGLGGNTGQGEHDGIEIVEVLDRDHSSADAFELGAPVTVGAYQYQLRQADGQNWFLQTNDVAPAAKAELVLPVALNQIGLNSLSTLWQRVGSRHYRKDSHGQALAGGVWTRSGRFSEKNQGALNSSDAFSGQAAYRLSGSYLQAGLDHKLMDRSQGELVGSAFGEYDSSVLNLKNGLAGQAEVKGMGFGGAITWYGKNGFYLDGLGKVLHYTTNLQANGNNGTPSGHGLLLSMEGGYTIKSGKNWMLIPQAQLVWQRQKLNGFNDSEGKAQESNSNDDLTMRAGLAWNYVRPKSAGHELSAYIKADLLHSFKGGALATFSQTGLEFKTSRTSLELGVGGAWTNTSGRLSVYGEVSYRQSVDHHASQRVAGTIGLRHSW
ncbi:autotransporter outer membrane beta-barrel domain-containing protein [Chromobacterium haemolyticum]|uniref:autotransporter family protein n=1 Tax=Chromobacterium haemolyticum TaxID=394935 RepID=UPI000DEF2C15|nr:autotransporter outer membrane beta-barrel domain-containing protein [Chromobacterium haemolyticum]